MIWIQGLDNRFARLLAAAGAAGDLRQQLKRPLRGTEVCRAETHVGRHHADERDARKIVSLRDHLRPDEHVDLAVAESRQQRGQRPSAANRIAVEPRDARRPTQPLDLRLDALGAESGLLQIRAGAQRTRGRNARGVVTVVAPRAPRPTFAVNHQRDTAVGAIQRPRALTAEHGGREAAPIQEDERLLLAIEASGNGVP